LNEKKSQRKGRDIVSLCLVESEEIRKVWRRGEENLAFEGGKSEGESTGRETVGTYCWKNITLQEGGKGIQSSTACRGGRGKGQFAGIRRMKTHPLRRGGKKETSFAKEKNRINTCRDGGGENELEISFPVEKRKGKNLHGGLGHSDRKAVEREKSD